MDDVSFYKFVNACYRNEFFINEIIELNVWLTLDCTIGSLSSFLEKWQTLAAAMIALCAAYSANKLIAAQIAQTKDLEDKKIEGLHTAYRASLVLTLTKIVRYCKENSNILKTVHQNISEAHTINIAVLPDAFEVAIERVISTSPSKNLTELLITLIRKLQLFDSRMHSLKDHKSNREIITPTFVETLIRQCVHIHSICDPLMEYARFRDENVPNHIDWSVYDNSISNLDYHRDEFEDLFSEMDRLKSQGKMPDIY